MTRTEALSAALAERARLSLYLQHDMRNLAQWVGWVCSDFVACTESPALLAAARRLQDNAPLAQERAQRLMAALGNDSRPATTRVRSICAMAMHQGGQLAGIEVAVAGEATAWIAPELLARALDNLLSNLAPNWREARPTDPRRNCARSSCRRNVGHDRD